MKTMRIKRGLVGALVFLILAFVASNWKSAVAVTVGEQDKPAPPQEKLAEEAYKNIQVFKGIPASRLMGAMNFFARSLGVDCAHCHVPNEFDKDDKPPKQTARKMYEMVRLAQKELGNTRVSCFMCHRGHVQPEPPPESWKAEAEAIMKQAGQDNRPVEQVYKNIQRLKGVPAGRWMLIMQMFSKSLGVKCDYCHVPDAFDKDDKPAKQTARKMLGMVGSIAREIYKGSTNINCYTCHKGQPQPVAFPPPASDAKPAETKPPETKPPEPITTRPMPSADEVLGHYIKAVGGKRALGRLSSRVMRGTLLQGGMSAPLEIFEQAPGKMLAVFQTPGSSVSIGWAGDLRPLARVDHYAAHRLLAFAFRLQPAAFDVQVLHAANVARLGR